MSLRKRITAEVFILLLLAVTLFVVADEFIDTTTTVQAEQWMVSGHNFDPVTAEHPATGASCVRCHNSDWYIKVQVNGEEQPAEDLAEPAKFGHTCKTCHEVENPTNILALRKVGNVTLPAYQDIVHAGISASCMSCHNERRENPEEYVKTAYRGTHEGPQSDMLSGKGAISYGETFGSSAHAIVTTKGCLTCHFEGAPAKGERGYNQVGGHTFKMSWDGGTPNNPTDDVYNVGSCQQCHPGMNTFDVKAKGDYDGDGTVEGVQTEVKGLLELLAAELPKNEEGEVAIPSDLTLSTVEQRMANFNYTLVAYDKSYGIHNTAYAVQVLRTTYEKLTGKKLAGDTIIAVPLPAIERPVTTESIEKRVRQWEASPHNFNPEEDFGEVPIEAGCVRCHNSEWFVKVQVKGEPLPTENLPLEDMPEYAHTCSTCHAIDNETNIIRLNLVGNVTLPAYNDVVDAGISAACMSCHNGRRVNPEKYVLTSRRGTHGGPQGDMFAGKGGISYGKTLESSSHFTAIEKKCVGCHMGTTPAKGKPGNNLVGEHTFRMVTDNGTPDDPKDDVQNVATCQKCHPGITTFDFPARVDYDGDRKIEGVQTEIKGMLAALAMALPHDDQGNIAIPADLTLSTVEQRMANFNYTLVSNDGSYGVHNFKYAVDLLRTAYKNLTGEDLGGGKDYSNTFFVDMSRGLNMISLPLDPSTPYTAKTLADQLSATMVIKYDEALQKFVGFVPQATGDGFSIEGGKGYIVNLTKDGSYVFTGAAWANEPTVKAAPPANPPSNLWAFVVSGSLLDGDTMGVGDGVYNVMVKNLRTRVTAVADLNSNGFFTAAYADLNRKPVVEVGDRIEVTVLNAKGAIVSGPFIHKVTPDGLKDAVVNVRMKLGEIVPANSALLQNYPNPFNPETWIPFNLKDANNVSVTIYNASGQMIRTLNLGYKNAGIYTSQSKAAYWDGRNEAGEEVSSGIYFYSIKAGDFSATRKMIVKK